MARHWLVLVPLLLIGCSGRSVVVAHDSTSIVSAGDASPTDDRANVDGRAPVADVISPDSASLDDCSYDPSGVCYDCGQCSLLSDRVFIGCSAPNKCNLFCAHSCLPDGFEPCSGGDDPRCSEWEAPRGDLSLCTEYPSDFGGIQYCCSFCPNGHPTVTCGQDANGNRVTFCDSCMAKGYRFCDPP